MTVATRKTESKMAKMADSSKEDLAVLGRLRNRLKTDNQAVQRILVDAGIMTKTGRLTRVYSGKR